MADPKESYPGFEWEDKDSAFLHRVSEVLDERSSKLRSILEKLERRVGDPNYPVLTGMEDIVTAVINELKEEGRP